MQNIKANLDNLNLLCKCNKKKIKSIISNSNKKFINCICECILNCLNGNVSLTKNEINRLKKYKNVLRKLLEKKSLKHKKKLLIQQGSGFLPILVPSVLELLSRIF